MRRHLRRLASITFGALAFCVVVMPLTAQAAVAPTASSNGSPGVSPAQKAAWQRATAEGLAVTATAHALAPYLVRQPDGTLTLDAPAAVVDRLPSKYVGELSVGLRALNADVTAGKLQTTAAGAVFDPKTVGFTFQGGWSGHGQDWWHIYWCLSHSDIVALNAGWWWDISAFGNGVIAALSGPVGAGLGVVFLFKGWMTADDHGNGSCMNFGHWPPPNIWVTSQ